VKEQGGGATDGQGTSQKKRERGKIKTKRVETNLANGIVRDDKIECNDEQTYMAWRSDR
jgi:hypothetical protein